MLFILISRFARPGMRQGEAHSRAVQLNRVPGGYSEGETPGPIPNPEVKLFSADGTAREASWESRTPPRILSRKPGPCGGRAFLLLAFRFGRGCPPAPAPSRGNPGQAADTSLRRLTRLVR